MNKDFRLNVGFISHPKTVKLRRRCGDAAVLSLIALFGFTAQNKPDGNLAGMSDEDIGIAAKWDGEPAIFVSALLECRFLDDADGHFVVHDWAMHNGWAANAPSRSEQGKKAASHRWQRNPALPPDAIGNAASINQHSDGHKPALPSNANSNAPTPIPSPIPNPSPSPSPEDRNPQLAVAVFLWAPTSEGRDYPITFDKLSEWRSAFPGVDVEAETRKAVQWSRDNGLKTYKGMAKFIGSWLGRIPPQSAPITVHPVDAALDPAELAELKRLKAESDARYAEQVARRDREREEARRVGSV